MLILVASPVVATHEPGHADPTEPARFLSAEAQRLIQTEFTTVKQDLKDYQDENFIALDGQMRAVITEAQQKLVIGGIGAVLLAGAIVAFFMFHLARKYSYETYLEGQLEHQQNEAYADPSLQPMQQQQWEQQPAQTIGMDQGQAFVSNTSQFNNWQVQAPHQDGWEWQGGGGGYQ
jgi:hypothetical protein